MSGATVTASIGAAVVTRLARDIAENAAWLSELDGAVGDGDHGVNMRNGLELAARRVPADATIGTGFTVVAETLMNDVGGAMGPLYGVFFLALAEAAGDRPALDAEAFAAMLAAGAKAVVDLGGARPGDKTLVDVLDPATARFAAAVAEGEAFGSALAAMVATAEERRDATKDLVARLGRSSRVAERSLGHIDAGAASCAVLLRSIATSLREQLDSADAVRTDH